MNAFTSRDLELIRMTPEVPRSILDQADAMGDALELTIDDCDELLQHVGEFLTQRGFDLDYEPTPLGVELERLIDHIVISGDVAKRVDGRAC